MRTHNSNYPGNYKKFDRFYHDCFDRTKKKYTSSNFTEIEADEHPDGFVCRSDTIFCIDEFKGFDNGYFANYPNMKGRSVSYAASFGDSHFDDISYHILIERLQNFKAIGLRENAMLNYVHSHTTVPCERTIDPALLLTAEDYASIEAEKQYDFPYLLLYTRQYDSRMEDYTENYCSKKRIENN